MGKRSRKRAAQPAGKPARAAKPAAGPKPARAAKPARKAEGGAAPEPAARKAEGRAAPEPAAGPAAPGGGAAARESGGNGAPAKPLSRSEAKDAAARAALEPLEEGERPQVVTVAAVVAALLGLANAVPFFFGIEVRGDDPQPGVLVFSFVLFVAAWGMWKAKYWAVLGMQALLALIILVFSLLLTTAENWHSALIALAVVAAAGLLFWKLVKALARIQMPERRPS